MLARISLVGMAATLFCVLINPFLGMDFFRTAVPYLAGLLVSVHIFSCLRQFEFLGEGNKDFWNKVLAWQTNPDLARRIGKGFVTTYVALFAAAILSFFFMFGGALTGKEPVFFEPTILVVFSTAFLTLMAAFFYASYLINTAYNRKRGGFL